MPPYYFLNNQVEPIQIFLVYGITKNFLTPEGKQICPPHP